MILVDYKSEEFLTDPNRSFSSNTKKDRACEDREENEKKKKP